MANAQDELNPKLASIFGRRSVRAYTSERVPESLVMELLRAAAAAPSACGKDPWRFVVVRKKEMLDQLAAALPNGKMLATASAGIVVCGDLEIAHSHELSYLLQDCSAAIENLLLSAHVLGLGACWLGVHPRQPRIDALRQLLDLPARVLPVSAVAIGYPAETHEPRTRLNPDHVHLERW